jgi:hypothetical protein
MGRVTQLTPAKVAEVEEAIAQYKKPTVEVEERLLGWVKDLLEKGATPNEILRFFEDRKIPASGRWVRSTVRSIRGKPGTSGAEDGGGGGVIPQRPGDQGKPAKNTPAKPAPPNTRKPPEDGF